EQKLFETEDNLNRVQDIIYELENQLEPLAHQSAQAKEYLQLKEQFVALDTGITVEEIDKLRDQWTLKNQELLTIQQSLETVQQELQEQEILLGKLRAERAQLDQEL